MLKTTSQMRMIITEWRLRIIFFEVQEGLLVDENYGDNENNLYYDQVNNMVE